MIRLLTIFLTPQECERFSHVLVDAGYTVGPLIGTKTYQGDETRLGYTSLLKVSHPTLKGTEAPPDIKKLCVRHQLRFLAQIGQDEGTAGLWIQDSICPIQAQLEPQNSWDRICEKFGEDV